jgi:predicted helicase
MLAQHMITKPVFDALFAEYAFTDHNPVSQVIDGMVTTLTAMHVDAEAESLEKFYDSVRLRAAGIDNAEGKQKIITELYESFFSNAFPQAADAMGVVYTPIEVVDFILRSVNDVLQQEFGRSISDEGVHVLDPFTGTGTFIVRLLQSGLIDPADLARKYASELHANEILLLAYYIAAINIETTFHDLQAQAHDVDLDVEDYEPFSGIVLTDTFQLTEDGDLTDEVVFPANNTRAEAQKKLDIQVIVGNPPYSVGQTSGNDDNANVSYPTLDTRVRDTFAARTDATNKNSLYDSYLRAIRWASDRIGSEGVIGFVTNGGWIEGNTAAGVRKTLAEEFSSIYVFNLRGNARTAGVLRQKEKGNVFGSGGRTTIAVFLLVRTQGHVGPATIHYRDIGDYLSREEKLAIVADSTLDTVPWQQIAPNRFGDWINQRDEDYLTYPILGGQPTDGVLAFGRFSAGLQTNRDAWVYNSSLAALDANLDRFVETYDAERARFAQYAATHNLAAPKGSDTVGVVSTDDTQIKWTSGLRDRAAKNRPLKRSDGTITKSLYRPFMVQHVDITDGLIHRPAVTRRYFPTAHHDNYGFYVNGTAAGNPFACLATRTVPCLDLFGKNGQFFPRYRWEPAEDEGTIEFDLGGEVIDGYRRVDNITEDFHRLLQDRYGSHVTKDDIFLFLYGLLHSPEYRERYAGELTQMLPRIPHVPAESFQPFVEAGRELFHLHADYEEVEPYPLDIVGTEHPPPPAALFDDSDHAVDVYRVQKMRFPTGKKASDAPDTLILNPHITVRGIPEEAYRYQLGSRSAIEWIIRQYQVTTDKASGIVNDPNQWGIEHDNPRYILDLLQKVVTVSVRTVEITENLPAIDS